MRVALIDGFPNYLVNEAGEVSSIDRFEWVSGRHPTPFKRKRKGRFIKPKVSNSGYYQVGLYNKGKVKRALVHRLVAKAFLDNSLNLSEVNHKDGDKLNNNFSNLEWCSRSENCLHSTKILGKNIGESSGTSKLKKDQVMQIVSLLEESTMTLKQIGDLFGVTQHAIFRIQHGYNWSWLTGYERKDR